MWVLVPGHRKHSADDGIFTVVVVIIIITITYRINLPSFLPVRGLHALWEVNHSEDRVGDGKRKKEKPHGLS